MESIGRNLVLAGLGLVVIGFLVWLLGRAGFRGLPGDIRYETDRVRLYFPIVSSLVVSVLLTVGMWLWQWISRK